MLIPIARCESGTPHAKNRILWRASTVLANKVTHFESEESVEANNHVFRPCRGGCRSSVSKLWVVARRTHAGGGTRIRVPRLWRRVRSAANRVELETGEWPASGVAKAVSVTRRADVSENTPAGVEAALDALDLDDERRTRRSAICEHLSPVMSPVEDEAGDPTVICRQKVNSFLRPLI